MKTIRVDVTNPDNIFVHKGWARKGHTYLTVRTQVISEWLAQAIVSHDFSLFTVPQS